MAGLHQVCRRFVLRNFCWCLIYLFIYLFSRVFGRGYATVPRRPHHGGKAASLSRRERNRRSTASGVSKPEMHVFGGRVSLHQRRFLCHQADGWGGKWMWTGVYAVVHAFVPRSPETIKRDKKTSKRYYCCVGRPFYCRGGIYGYVLICTFYMVYFLLSTGVTVWCVVVVCLEKKQCTYLCVYENKCEVTHTHPLLCCTHTSSVCMTWNASIGQPAQPCSPTKLLYCSRACISGVLVSDLACPFLLRLKRKGLSREGWCGTI